MNYSLSKVLAAYRAFAHEKTTTPQTRAQLVRADATLKLLGRQLAALPAPPDALHLRADVLRLVAREAEITHEVSLLARFAPPFSASLGRLHRAGAALGRSLAAIRPPTPHVVRGTKKQIAQAQAAFAVASDQSAAAEADAVDAYDAAVAATLARLHRLLAPPALEPALRSEVRGLTATHDAGKRLAAALRLTNRSQVPELGRAFTIATRTAQSIPAQLAEIGAVKAYDARVRRLTSAATAVQHEIARLQSVD